MTTKAPSAKKQAQINDALLSGNVVAGVRVRVMDPTTQQLTVKGQVVQIRRGLKYGRTSLTIKHTCCGANISYDMNGRGRWWEVDHA